MYGEEIIPEIVERGLCLWWAFDGRNQKKTIKDQITATKDIRKVANDNYVDFKTGGYSDKEKYEYLIWGSKKK